MAEKENLDEIYEEEPEKEDKVIKFRLGLVLIIAAFIFLVSFLAYMLDTKLEDVVEKETGSSVVTHDTTFEEK